MKLSLQWLSRYLDLSGISPSELAERLTMSGIEVSAIQDLAARFHKIVTARLVRVFPHPNADKLQLTEVEIPGKTFQVVCGAKNIQADDIVPLALEGAVLPSGIVIKAAKIRGEESFGMLCSAWELGLSEDRAGILHFPPDTPLGVPIAPLVNADDILFEVEVTPNRSDCLSHLGIARHLSALFHRELHVPETVLQESEELIENKISVEIFQNLGCRRYCAKIIQGVSIQPSPDWLKSSLEKVGIRSINNVVDVTNFILMDIGHPLHVFDYRQISGQKIVVRLAKEKETLVTLDGVTRVLSGNELVIADIQKPLALAGVMGGKNSEVTPQTHDILLEAAWFEPQAVRKTIQATNCRSDSSFRFERGVDPEAGLLVALNKAADLIVKLAGGKLFKGTAESYPMQAEKRSCTLSFEKASKLLGMPVDKSNLSASLVALGLSNQLSTDNLSLNISIPTFRHDLRIEEDIVEEIAQQIGYDQIPYSYPKIALHAPEPNPKRKFIHEVKNILISSGFSETISYSFMDDRHFDWLKLSPDHLWRKTLDLQNPLSVESACLRTSLLPGLLETYMHNERRGHDRASIFEVGSVFRPISGQSLPNEPIHLGFLVAGIKEEPYWKKNRPDSWDIFDLKGLLQTLLQRLQIPIAEDFMELRTLPFLHPELSYRLQNISKTEFGWMGALHPSCQETYKFKQSVLIGELSLDTLWDAGKSRARFHALSRFPGTSRDISIAVKEAIPVKSILRDIQAAGGPYLARVVLFDLYRGPELPEGIKSLSFSLDFQADDLTLRDDEVQGFQTAILKKLKDEYGVEQR